MGFVSPLSKREENGRTRCLLCPRGCTLTSGKVGICRTRSCVDGDLVVDTHGVLAAAAVDPIEKKPMYHFLPRSKTFSVASVGCNLVCPFCQNHSLSFAGGERARTGRPWSPEEICREAVAHECASISFTYSEPILMLELAQAVARVARNANLSTVFVTNGQATKTAAQAMAGFLSAANVDIKCFSEDAYEKTLGGSLRATLDTVEILIRGGVWVEVTTLVIPGFNDSEKELTAIAKYVAALDPNIPWHVSRFHPAHHWTHLPPTPVSTIEGAVELGRAEGLRYVYAGNIPGTPAQQTRCWECGAELIDRTGYRIGPVKTAQGRCGNCGAQVAGKGFP